MQVNHAVAKATFIEKYGILSEDFYAALTAGMLADYDSYDETRADFSRWKGIFETWQRRKESYASNFGNAGFQKSWASNPRNEQIEEAGEL